MYSSYWSGLWRGQRPAGDDHTRARTVIRHTGGIVRYKIQSRKVGRTIHCEGPLERDAAIVLEATAEIVRYREQPCQIWYPYGDRLRKYTPDFEIVMRDGQVRLLEVKPDWKLIQPEEMERLSRIQAHLESQGRAFQILPASAIRREPRFENCKTLFRFGRGNWMDRRALSVRVARYEVNFPMTLATALTNFPEEGATP